jgi:hypothetical protein
MLHTYKALHQRCISTEVIIGEKQYAYVANLRKTMDNVQERNNCTNLPLSQTFRSFL